MAEHDMPMRYSLQLKDLRKKRGLTQAGLADALGVEQPTVQRWESGARTPDVSQLLQISEALGVEPGELFGSSSIVSIGPRLFVKGEVAAGVWREAWELSPDEWEVFTGRADVKVSLRKRFGLRVVGDSMDLLYPHGTILECIALDRATGITSGKRVVVQRRRAAQEYETTVKEYFVDREGVEWLLPRSSNPAFQRPIQVGVEEDAGIEAVEIIGVVVGSYRPE